VDRNKRFIVLIIITLIYDVEDPLL